MKRYTNETRRLYSVLNTQLENSTSGYLVGDKCTIADIAHWGWIAAAFWAGVDINEFPALKAWDDRMLARPGVEKGRHVPDPHRMKVREKHHEALQRALSISQKSKSSRSSLLTFHSLIGTGERS